MHIAFKVPGLNASLRNGCRQDYIIESLKIKSVAGLRFARETSLRLPDYHQAGIGPPACFRILNRYFTTMETNFKVRAFGSALAVCNATGAACNFAPGNPVFCLFALVGLFSKFRSNFNSMIPPHWIEFVYVFRFHIRATIGSSKRKANDET